MDFHHAHFYVDNVWRWGDWFIETLGFEPVLTEQSAIAASVPPSLWLRQGTVRLRLSSPAAVGDAVSAYLQAHPPGVTDLAFAVADLQRTLSHLLRQGARLLRPPRWLQLGDWTGWGAQVAGWAGLAHTLLERSPSPPVATAPLVAIDHAVLNVASGELAPAAAWYCRLFGFCPQQQFEIQTPSSGLYSQVLAHPEGTAQLPINEPSTANSQIQEFLSLNRGAGIQHIALRTHNLAEAVAKLRDRGLELLSVPESYYQQLAQRPGYRHNLADWQAIAQQQILADWPPDTPAALLLQTFTAPIFDQPTFFFELIERRGYVESGQPRVATGFGEGNFQALFEAIEREQHRRGTLQPRPAADSSASSAENC